MNCPVCNQTCQETHNWNNSNVTQYTCMVDYDHHFTYGFTYQDDFVISLQSVYFETKPWNVPHLWIICSTKNQQRIAQGNNQLLPQQAYQLLLRYDSLMAFL